MDDLRGDSSRLVRQLNTCIDRWQSSMRTSDFQAAAETAVAFLKEIAELGVNDCSREFRECIHACCIILNGLCDVADVCIITSRHGWIEHSKAVEEVWSLIFDAKDRLTRCVELESAFAALCMRFLEAPFDMIQSRYGHGTYLSWELTLDGLNCSICAEDIRGCEHIAGQSYGEQVCICKPVGGYLSAVSIVKHPHDPRCRIWPWHLKGPGSDGMMVFHDVCIYRPFDPEGLREPRGIVDLTTIFS